jgi:(1->4)-alpha-D-glucan 1-alpha-D-glucosylmutase
MSFPEVVYEKKKLVMQVAMSSEVNTLGHYLNDLSEKNRHTRDFTLNSLTAVITEVIACFPVYRTYTNSGIVSDRDRHSIEAAVAKAKRRNPAISESIFNFLQDILLLRFPQDMGGREKGEWLDFVMRFQQLSGPVMAKGAEDTACYVYNRLLSLNEVGGMPERFGVPLDTFHGQNIERAKSWPRALITTSTHDTKRGEGVRARINVLSEIPREWAEQVRNWARMNRKRKKKLPDGREAPDRNEEYLLYQTLVGAWPVEPFEGSGSEVFVQRIKDYMIKASREAKVNTSWISPDSQYEEATLAFIDALLSRPAGNPFLQSFLPFQTTVSHCGMFNALSQTLLKICAPGVPDFYQGTELWDFDLVDPDNRRPVDYDKRTAMLAELRRAGETVPAVKLALELSLAKEDGRIMLYLVSKALGFRREHSSLFASGDYLPLTTEGGRAEHVCAFERRRNRESVIVAAPRFLTRLISGGGSVPFGKAVWEDTRLVLPDAGGSAQYRNILTAEVLSAGEAQGTASLPLAGVFASFPVALLERTG